MAGEDDILTREEEKGLAEAEEANSLGQVDEDAEKSGSESEDDEEEAHCADMIGDPAGEPVQRAEFFRNFLVDVSEGLALLAELRQRKRLHSIMFCVVHP